MARALLAATVVAAALALAGPAGAARYLVLYKQQPIPAGAERAIENAGGRVLASYGAIGVAVATSSSPSFADRLLRDVRVRAASPTDGLRFDLGSDLEGFQGFEAEGLPLGDLPNVPATDGDTLSGMQWDMQQIHAPEAHAVTGGSPSVVVGVIDTGIDPSHPDLAQNVDAADSVSCETGVPVQDPALWNDDNGHGTFVAGLIAAASNTTGIVGVAPNVRVAAIDVRPATRGIFVDAVVCAFYWAGSHHLDVANNSYVIDPNLFNCHNDPAQQAIWTAVQRAIRYAMNQGVTVVASAGNENTDLAHPPLGNNCVKLPAEVPGVITVSANGVTGEKAFYSDYGVGVISVVAPGGDPTQPATPTLLGTVLSTWPAAQRNQSRVIFRDGAYYRFDFGSSFAAPHVSGLAALVISRYGDSATPENGKLRPGAVAALIERTADPQPCPPEPFVAGPLPSPPFPPNQFFPATCQGGDGYNGFYGHGQVNALTAVGG